MSEGQGHSHLYQNIEVSLVDHHAKFGRNLFITLQTRANVKHILLKITEIDFAPLNINHEKEIIMRLNRRIGHRNIPNFIEID